MKVAALVACAVALVSASDNGRAITPPMGWRSWNLYGANVDQKLIEGIMDGMVVRKRLVDGTPTSLCDLGYCDVGLDDNWQGCGMGKHWGTSFHNGTDGRPFVNTLLFPDMKNMTDHAHALGLTAGWYGNNCICREFRTGNQIYYQGDVDSLMDFGFDSWKLDGCGVQTDLEMFYDIVNKTGRAITVENCHWGSKKPYEPTKTWCPWNMYRTSGDVRAVYSSVLANLETTFKYSNAGLSYPGCWAYPDMLEVGCQHGPGGNHDPGLSPAETRTHFAAWVIVSSPLTLSHDVNNDTVMDEIWDLISNTEAIAVNQAWAGYSGGPFKQSKDYVNLGEINYAAVEKGMSYDDAANVVGGFNSPSFQYLQKPVGGGKIAVLLMNAASGTVDLVLDFSDVPGLTCTTCKVRDIYAKKDLGSFTTSYNASSVGSHDVAFLMISP